MRQWFTFATPGTTCPHCGSANTHASNFGRGNGAPREGCLCVCAHCARISAFTADMKLRAATGKELADLPADHREEIFELARRVRRAISSLN